MGIGLGLWEMALIGCVILLFYPPSSWPKIIQEIAKIVVKLKRFSQEMKDFFMESMRQEASSSPQEKGLETSNFEDLTPLESFPQKEESSSQGEE